MKLRDIVCEKAVIASLSQDSRDDVIAELLEALVEAGQVDASLKEDLVAAVLEREKRGSTGFGKGVAVPHVKHTGIDRMTAAVGISDSGVDFNALDKQPVYSVFLLLSPSDRPDEHLQAMETIFKNLSTEKFRRFLRQASSVEEICQLLDDADNQTLGA